MMLTVHSGLGVENKEATYPSTSNAIPVDPPLVSEDNTQWGF